MKKVLAIAPYSYLPFYSGGQKFIANFLEHLGKKTELTVVSVMENDFTLAKSYQAYPLLKKSFSRYIDRSLLSKITELITQKQVDTVICEHPYFAWLAFGLRKRTGVTVIIHTHNIEYQRFRSTRRWWWPILEGYEKRSFRKADRLLFISPEDRDFAVKKWKIPPEKCIDLPYGIETGSHPDKVFSSQNTRWNYGATENEKILLFAGLLNYQPNIDALKIILDKINPLFVSAAGFQYKIIVCGKGLPGTFNELKAYCDINIIYAGYVEDIDNLYKGADIFLNPVLSGGGVKTKVLEAIAAGTTVVSTETGAKGIQRSVCGEKLIEIKDNDWESFAKAVIEQSKIAKETPGSFYETYNWDNIIKHLIHSLPQQPAG